MNEKTSHLLIALDIHIIKCTFCVGGLGLRLLILVVGIVLLALLWTNPDSSDFEKWVYKKEVTYFQRSTPLEPVGFRSKNYLFFSVHELLIVRQQTDLMTEYSYYGGVGIFGMIFPTSTPGVDGKQSPLSRSLSYRETSVQ
jgi:hypothetical protein